MTSGSCNNASRNCTPCPFCCNLRTLLAELVSYGLKPHPTPPPITCVCCLPLPQDPNAKKPEDWDERERIADPEDKKPAGYDDIPASIPDPEAKKPEDWNDEDDGDWEPPTIPNPEYKGEWAPKM